ncbi:MAG: hypothetical protein AAGF89_05860 [Bacteroidota bacterium]
MIRYNLILHIVRAFARPKDTADENIVGESPKACLFFIRGITFAGAAMKMFRYAATTWSPMSKQAVLFFAPQPTNSPPAP